MTRRYRSVVLDGVSHMIDDPAGDWVRWCDCRDMEGELARFREGMPELSVLKCASETLSQWSLKNIDHDCGWCATVTSNWLRSIAKESGGCGR